MIKNNYYNQSKKEDYLSTIDEKSKYRWATALFNKGSLYEFKFKKDMYDFSEQESIDLFINMRIVRYKAYVNTRKILNEWRIFNGRKPVQLIQQEKDYKELYINNGSIDYVLDENDLFSRASAAIAQYSKEHDNFDYTEYFSMPLVYMSLLYYGLSDEQIQTIKRSEIVKDKDFVLPNGRVVGKVFQELYADVAERNEYPVTSQTGKKIYKEYNKGNVHNLIRKSCSVLTTIFYKLSEYDDTLSLKNVIKAGLYNRVFEEDIRRHNFELLLTRTQIENDLDENRRTKTHGLSDVQEEQYNIFKGIRLKHNL